jgi:PPM family protein phosphatase
MNTQGQLPNTFAETDRGVVRENNEDSLLLLVPEDEKTVREKGILAIVADGVGGSVCGKMASDMAVNIMRDHYYASPVTDPLLALKESMEAANLGIIGKALKDPSCNGMATTGTAFVLLGHRGFVAHLGDSRAYLFRGGSLRRITNDHTLVNRLLDEGLITTEAADTHPQRNIITKSLGGDPAIEPDTCEISLDGGDIILLCSDGLYGLMSDGDISTALSSLPLEDAGASLIGLAKKNGGNDNITVVLLQLPENKKCGMSATRPFTSINSTRRNAVTASVITIGALFLLVIIYLWSTCGWNILSPGP